MDAFFLSLDQPSRDAIAKRLESEIDRIAAERNEPPPPTQKPFGPAPPVTYKNLTELSVFVQIFSTIRTTWCRSNRKRFPTPSRRRKTRRNCTKNFNSIINGIYEWAFSIS